MLQQQTKLKPHIRKTGGFTIVELLIVIVIIAILAAIVVVAYSGIKKQTAQAIVKDALSSTATAMKAQAVDTQDFSSIPTNVKISDKVGIALTELTPPATSTSSFCMNGTHIEYNDIAFHITDSTSVEEGFCPGTVLTGTIVGDYNYNADTSASLGYTPVTIGQAAGDKYGFVVETNLDWTEIKLKWDAQPNTAHYEIMTYGNSSVWNYRSISNGGSSCSGYGGTCSQGLAPATTSLAWTDSSYSLPLAPGQTYQYRLRTCPNTSNATNCTDWTTVSIDNPIQSATTVPKVSNFTVAAKSDWSGVALSWNSAPRFAVDMSAIHYEIMTYGNSNIWGYRSVDDGGSSCSGYGGTCSQGLAPATTSLTWTDTSYSLPLAPGRTYQYRIRVCTNKTGTYCGEWETRSIANPIQSTADVPSVSNFTVTPASDWSNISISWSPVAAFAKDMTAIHYEIMTYGSSSVWNYRSVSNGGGSCSGYGGTCSQGLIPATTSLTWTDTSYSVPSAGKTYQYRIRVCTNASSTYCGDWETRSISH